MRAGEAHKLRWTDFDIVNFARTQQEIAQLLELGFEYILQKDDLVYFRKRK